jgi:16S rRNA (cytosine967-C5)-methyltransferase
MPTEAREGEGAPALADVLVLASAAWSLLRSGHSLDEALQSELQQGSPSGQAADARMAGAVRDVTATAVRRCAIVEFLIRELLHRSADPAVRSLLAVSLAQLLANSYTPFTLVDQAVHAARLRPQTSGAASLVNAVLREFLRRRAELEEQAGADPARRWNVPVWWLQRLQSNYGAGAQEALAAQLEEPPLVLRVNSRRTTPSQVLARWDTQGLEASAVGPSALWLHRPIGVERIPGFAEGLVSVQDAGAQLAAPWLGACDGMRVLDACAAPGGKAAHLLEIADCRVDAVDVDPQRAALIESNLRRLGLAGANARVLVADIVQTASYWDQAPYDRILLDAPCSSSGVVRRHPEIPLLRRASDVAKLATRQAKMLHALWPLLAPAGRLLYVVCSVFAEEGRRQIAAFVRRQPGVRPIRLPGGGPDGLQLLPNSVAGASLRKLEGAEPVLHDGFFYALLEKI